MFTRDDLVSYLSDLEMVETNMGDIYEAAANEIEDKEIKEIFIALSKFEHNHMDLVSSLRKTIISRSLAKK